MQRANYDKVLLFIVIAIAILSAGTVLFLARRISLMEGEAFSLEAIIKAFDVIYLTAILPNANAIHAGAAGVLAVLVLIYNKY
ncbi:MAG TPA: hypothetical protein ENN07_07480 [candidate division Zixibacteria bacterium]|nr:hypothetical protein [candidate division Zixibacteria bacterium]